MSEKMRVLVVDDEESIRQSLQEILEDEGYEFIGTGTAVGASELIATGVDLVLLDIKLGEDDGIEVLQTIKTEYPAVPVIMISGHGTVALTAEAFRRGAHEFMEKPLRLVQVRTCVRNALESVRLKRRVAEQERRHLPRPVYRSQVMKNLFRQTARLAALAEPVVILGPSGAGKELVAHSLHYDGARSEGPFVATNAASMPVNLAEDELFGHEKGAFTGAHTQRKGCIEQASKGTLFLDEIGDLDLSIQAKLLRVLETGVLTRLGGTESIQAKPRIVAATHRDLNQLVERGDFRHDLWYRLCAFVIHVPSLADRKEDIPLLAEAFLAKVCTETEIVRRFSEDALQCLTSLPLPGNVRELKHVVTRAAVYAESEEIGVDTIRAVTTGQASPQSGTSPLARNYQKLEYRTARRRFEVDYLSAALQQHDYNITATAAAIGMAQSNLSRRLKQLGIR
ncbi:MAG: response regulator [Chitinivibrionales bacterium]|nr:response regulator [Chitinivibrionales bacterium]MBD3356836.1 response regulator [Chitinivibrionales bacterium]